MALEYHMSGEEPLSGRDIRLLDEEELPFEMHGLHQAILPSQVIEVGILDDLLKLGPRLRSQDGRHNDP